LKHSDLNILVISSWFPSPENKSHGIFYYRQAKALAEFNNVTAVFAKSLDSIEKSELLEYTDDKLKGVNYFYPKVKLTIPLISSFLKLWKYRQAYQLIFDKGLSNQQFDVVYVNTIFPAAVATLLAKNRYPKAKIIISEQWSGYYPEDGNYKGFVTKYFTQKLVKLSKAIFVVTDKTKQVMLSHGLKAKYELINNVVDTELFKPSEDKEKKKDVIKLLHVSSLVNREKNIIGILNAISLLKRNHQSVQLTIIGDNKAEMPVYTNIVKDLNIESCVEFVGYKKPDEIVKYMNQSDLFILFSFFEGMPNVILEALACGLPVVSTNVGAVSDMIKKDMGVILKSNSEEELADVISKFDRNSFLSKTEIYEYIKNKYGVMAVGEKITQLLLKHI
jgi:glycosyltransferase involved in cell wall biosynthesis